MVSGCSFAVDDVGCGSAGGGGGEGGRGGGTDGSGGVVRTGDVVLDGVVWLLRFNLDVRDSKIVSIFSKHENMEIYA